MNDDTLRDMLRRADADSDLRLVASRALVERVERLDRRRRRRYRAVVTVGPLMLLVAAMLAWQWIPERGADAPTNEDTAAQIARNEENDPVPSDLLAESERLEAEADFHQLVARRMIASLAHDETIQRARRELAAGDPADDLRTELDLVAFRMIYRADQLRATMQPATEAVAIYRNVIRLFPTTHSAELARARLAEIDTMNPPGGA